VVVPVVWYKATIGEAAMDPHPPPFGWTVSVEPAMTVVPGATESV
jgi:hypothetical protein